MCIGPMLPSKLSPSFLAPICKGVDVIIVADTNTPTTNFVTVLSNTGTVVDVSNGTAIVETDGD